MNSLEVSNDYVHLSDSRPLSQSTDKMAIYGNFDTRREPISLAVEQVQRQARSIACFVEAKSLHQLGPERDGRSNFELLGDALKLCIQPLGEKELFRDQITPAIGTAFLVELLGKRYLLTAAHMVCNDKTKKPDPDYYDGLRVIFDFQVDQEDRIIKTNYQEDEIYRISKVANYAFDRGSKFADWALLELDKEVNDREPLKCNFNHVAQGTPLYMLGHPSGLPLKYAEGSIKSQNRNSYFEADLDAFRGNSGSPVFNQASGEVVGILVEGNRDYERVYDYHAGGEWRWAVHRISQGEIDQNGYEKVQRMGSIQRKLSNHDALKRLLLDKLGKIQRGVRQEKAELSRRVRQLTRAALLGFHNSL